MSTKRSYILKQTVAFICRFIYFLKMLQFIFWLPAFMKHTFFNLEIFIPSFALSTNECFSRPCQRKAARKKWAKNEVFHWGFLQQMWPNPQETLWKTSFLCSVSPWQASNMPSSIWICTEPTLWLCSLKLRNNDGHSLHC